MISATKCRRGTVNQDRLDPGGFSYLTIMPVDWEMLSADRTIASVETVRNAE
jgi:hypothetical protein